MSYSDNDIRIPGLLRERAALAAQGKDDRVKQVDDELKARSYQAEESPEDKAVQARKQAPQGRSSKPQQTGD